MKLENKKNLVSRTLGVGRKRVIFNIERLAEIKEAITKQDIKDLRDSGAIQIKEVKGRKTIKKRKTRRRAGSIKKSVNNRKQEYVALTRKLRTFVKIQKERKKVSLEEYKTLRKEIKTSTFRSLSHMKERIHQFKEEE